MRNKTMGVDWNETQHWVAPFRSTSLLREEKESNLSLRLSWQSSGALFTLYSLRVKNIPTRFLLLCLTYSFWHMWVTHQADRINKISLHKFKILEFYKPSALLYMTECCVLPVGKIFCENLYIFLYIFLYILQLYIFLLFLCPSSTTHPIITLHQGVSKGLLMSCVPCMAKMHQRAWWLDHREVYHSKNVRIALLYILCE